MSLRNVWCCCAAVICRNNQDICKSCIGDCGSERCGNGTHIGIWVSTCKWPLHMFWSCASQRWHCCTVEETVSYVSHFCNVSYTSLYMLIYFQSHLLWMEGASRTTSHTTLCCCRSLSWMSSFHFEVDFECVNWWVCRDADETAPRVPTYALSNEKSKELGVHYQPTEDVIHETVSSLKECGWLASLD